MSRGRGIRVVPIAVLTMAVGACSTAEPIDVASGCPERAVRGPTQYASEPLDKLIDDFEDGDGQLAQVAMRNGPWVLGDDGTSGTITAETSSQCAARGTHAGHFAGAGLTNWGANWTAVFRAPLAAMAQAYDLALAGYGGISFWAALGTSAPDPPSGVRMGLTTIDVAWNGGVCTTTCMDFYGTDVPLTHAWQRVMIRFDDLAQVGWGAPQVPMRRDQGVGFIIWPDWSGVPIVSFDIWIDDVRLEP